MSINAAALRLMREKGLTLDDVVEIAAAMESRRDATGAERQQRHRDKKRANVTRDVTRDAETAPPNDIYSNPPENPVGAKAPTSPFAEKVVEAWNAGPAARGATKATKLDAGRRKHLAARVREHGENAVFSAIRGIEVSDFHCGIGEKSYRTNLGWLLKSPEHFVAAIERAGTAPAPAPKLAEADLAAHRASLADKPWMRGREAELAQPPPRNPTHRRGPIPVGDLVSRITDHAA